MIQQDDDGHQHHGTQSSRMRRLGIAILCCALVSPHAMAGPQVHLGPPVHVGSLAPLNVEQTAPTDAACRQAGLGPCYSPQEIAKAYGIKPLIDAGFAGAGQTIVIIDSFGSPTIAADLETFDAAFALPDPPSFQVLAPLGTVPFDPTDPFQVNWAAETTLDVEWAHAMAPAANIVLLTSPVNATNGTVGLPEFLALQQYALDHQLGQIISISWGATEDTLLDAAGQQVIAGFEAFYKRARAAHVTVLAAAGDTGSTAPELDLTTLYPHPAIIYPASSPSVTAVGGTRLNLDTAGNFQSETVWNDPGQGAGGGGISKLFKEPKYQVATLPPSANQQLNGARGIPDVSLNADFVNSSILIYLSFLGPAQATFFQVGGTSQGPPIWAGLVADLNQFAGQPLGFLNPSLYALGGLGQFKLLGRDITVGNNTFAGVPGFSATVGWDLASGWGTPNLGLAGVLTGPPLAPQP